MSFRHRVPEIAVFALKLGTSERYGVAAVLENDPPSRSHNLMQFVFRNPQDSPPMLIRLCPFWKKEINEMSLNRYKVIGQGRTHIRHAGSYFYIAPRLATVSVLHK